MSAVWASLSSRSWISTHFHVSSSIVSTSRHEYWVDNRESRVQLLCKRWKRQRSSNMLLLTSTSCACRRRLSHAWLFLPTTTKQPDNSKQELARRNRSAFGTYCFLHSSCHVFSKRLGKSNSSWIESRRRKSKYQDNILTTTFSRRHFLIPNHSSSFSVSDMGSSLWKGKKKQSTITIVVWSIIIIIVVVGGCRNNNGNRKSTRRSCRLITVGSFSRDVYLFIFGREFGKNKKGFLVSKSGREKPKKKVEQTGSNNIFVNIVYLLACCSFNLRF